MKSCSFSQTAQKLAKKTGYKVLHNHLTIDLLRSLFDWRSKPYNELIKKCRLELLEAAAKYKIPGVITTLVYAAEADDQEMHELVRKMKRAHVTVCFVQLLCEQRELEKRITHESRKQYTKIRHVKNLRDMMGKFDTLKPVPHGNNLVIDSTHLTPARTVNRIMKHFHLPNA